MKSSSMSFSSVVSLTITTIVVVSLFLITTSIVFAQTTVDIRPGTIDVSNLRSEYQRSTTTKPVPTLFKNTDKEVRKVDRKEVRKVDRVDDANYAPRTFLEKARNIIQKKQIGAEQLQDKKENRREHVLNSIEQKRIVFQDFLIRLKERWMLRFHD